MSDIYQHPTWDDISPLLERVRSQSIRVMSKAATTQRMGWILDALNISTAQFKNWCGLSLREWKTANASWTEREFCELICENYHLMNSHV